MTSKRFDYIDAARAFGMLIIIWGHTYYGFSTFYLFSFTIAMFFILSGMVFSTKKYSGFKPFFLHKARTLLVPYAIYSIITWIIWSLYVTMTNKQVDSIWMPLLETFISRGGQDFLIHNAPLWFIPCLFVLEITYYWISRLHNMANIFLCFFIAAISYYLINYITNFNFKTIPWSIDVAMLALPLYASGHLLIKKIGHANIVTTVNDHKIIFAIISILLFIGVYFTTIYNDCPSLGRANLNNPFLFYLGAFMGSTATIIVSVILSDIMTSNKIWRGLLWFGANSLIALSIHNPIKGFLLTTTATMLNTTIQAVRADVWISLALWIITLTITVLLMVLIVRFKKNVSKNK